MPKNPGYDSYDVETTEGATVEISEDEAEDLAAAVLEESLQLVDREPAQRGDKTLKAALVAVLQFMDGQWGHYRWKSLADKHKHQETHLNQGD
jgi:hypothetical protein